MVVVSDAGPLISLAVIDQLGLLEALYSEVVISETVWREVTRLIERFNIPQIYTLESRVRPLVGVNTFSNIMDAGEAESAALYQELGADYFIVDDGDARRTAEAHGIKCVGALGVLLKSKEAGLITSLRPHFAVFVKQGRYYKKGFLNALLAENGEAPLP
ncbi:MAG: hypothetical protein LBR16_07400 [Treponema sp.]|jgi:predicted nucleic acid-binding protein|nr:hypothetical protein [Treponema sp.]